jgi:hypothetical protein
MPTASFPGASSPSNSASQGADASQSGGQASKVRNLLARSPVRALAQIPDSRASNRAVMPVAEILLLATCKTGKVGLNLQEVAL